MAQPLTGDRWMFFVGGFAAKGPLFGGLVVLAELLVAAAATSSLPSIESWHTLPMALVGVVGFAILSLAFGYVLGMIPALLAGFICYPMSRIPMPVWGWVGACAAVGAVASGLIGLLFAQYFGPFLLMAAILPGAVAAGACAWLARERRLSL